ncbi:MAG: methyltransferase domain-containing protein [Chloroflexota bacterium]|nr:MAG: methyltransferase domain-containing protein [Chloroflexota bacterium]
MVRDRPPADVIVEVRLEETVTDKVSQDAYDSVYDQTDISQSDSFYIWLYELLDLQASDVFLDISTGKCDLLAQAQQHGIQAYGNDLSIQALLGGRADFGAQPVVVANSQQLPFANESFSVVSNIGSLEHFTDMPAAIRDKSRLLIPGGRAIILVPNTYSLLNNIWYAFRHGRTSIDPYQPIQRYAARYEWQKLIESNGLVVEKTIGYDRVRPRTWADLADYLRRPKDLIKLLLSRFIPLNLAFCFIFFCKKPETDDRA